MKCVLVFLSAYDRDWNNCMTSPSYSFASFVLKMVGLIEVPVLSAYPAFATIAFYPNPFCRVRSWPFSPTVLPSESVFNPSNQFSLYFSQLFLTARSICKWNIWRRRIKRLLWCLFFAIDVLEFLFSVPISLEISVNTFQFTTCDSTPLAICRVPCIKVRSIFCRCYGCYEFHSESSHLNAKWIICLLTTGK